MSLHDAACEQHLPELDHSHRKVSLFVDCGFLLRISFFFLSAFYAYVEFPVS